MSKNIRLWKINRRELKLEFTNKDSYYKLLYEFFPNNSNYFVDQKFFYNF